MRKLKFRAWDKKKQVMLDSYMVGKLLGTTYFSDMVNDENIVLIQFIGKIDKDGRDIYEDDVVKCVNGHIGRVVWDDGFCGFNVEGYYHSMNDWLGGCAFMEGEGGPFEVIGNVWENPELGGE